MRPLLEDRALLVLHKLEASLAAYEVPGGRERFRIPTGPFPHEMSLSPDRREVLVSEYGLRGVESEGEGGSTLGVFDLRRGERVSTIGLGRYRRPHGIAVHSGGRLFVTCEAQNAMLTLRLEDHTVLHAVDVGQDGPHMVAVSPDGRTVFTANLGTNSLTAVDVMMGVVLRHVKVFDRPGGLAFSPDGRFVYSVCREGAAVAVVDTTRLDVVAKIGTGKGPARIAITPDGRRIAFPLVHEDAVQVADVETKAVIHTIPVGHRPVGTALSADGRVLYVACEGDSRVYVIDLARGTVAGEIATGEGPGAVVALDLAEIG